jgi:RNA-binding protein
MESELTVKQRQFLRSLAHSQKPVVQIGTKGMGEGVIEQIRAQLEAHELIKVRFNTECAVEPGDVSADIVQQTRSHLVQHSGRILTLYRRHNQKPKIELPKRERPVVARVGGQGD